MKYHQRDIVEVNFLFPYCKLGSIKEKYFNEIVDKTIESIF